MRTDKLLLNEYTPTAWDLVELQILIRWGWGLIFCISHKFPDDALTLSNKSKLALQKRRLNLVQ